MTKRLPRKCQCGGKLVHVRDFGRVFTHCESCTPVVTITIGHCAGCGVQRFGKGKCWQCGAKPARARA